MINNLLVKLSDESLSDVEKSKILDQIKEILVQDPRLITPETRDSIIAALKSNKLQCYSKTKAVETIGIIAKSTPHLINSDMLRSIKANLVDSHMSNGLKAIILNSTSESSRSAAANGIGIIASMTPELIDIAVVEKLTQLLSDCGYGGAPARTAAASIKIIAERRPELIERETVVNLVKLLKDYDARSEVANSIREIVAKRPEFAETINSEIKIELFENSYVKQNVIRGIGFLIEVSSELIDISIINQINKALSDSFCALRSAAAYTIGKYRPELIEANIVDTLINLLGDKKIERHVDSWDNSHYYGGAAEESFETLMTIAANKPELINITILIDQLYNNSKEIPKERIVNILEVITRSRPETINIDFLITLLNDRDNDVRFQAIKIVKNIFSQKADLINRRITNNLIRLLSDCFSVNVRSSAADSLKIIAKNRPELISIEDLIKHIRDSDLNVRSETENILKIMVDRPNLVGTNKLFYNPGDSSFSDVHNLIMIIGIKVIIMNKPELISSFEVNLLTDFLYDSNQDIRLITTEALRDITDFRPDLIDESMTELIISILNSQDIRIDSTAAEALKYIAINNIQFLSRNVDSLIEKLSDSVEDASKVLVNTLGRIAANSFELIDINRLHKLLSHNSKEIKSVAIKALGALAVSCSSETDFQSIIEELFNQLKDTRAELRLVVANSLGDIITKKTELIDSLIVEKIINELLRDKSVRVNEVAKNAIQVINSDRPELLSRCDYVTSTISNKTGPEDYRTKNLKSLIDSLKSKNPADYKKDRPIIIQALTDKFIKGSELIKIGELLTDRNQGIREGAIKIVGFVCEKKSELIHSNIIEKLLKILDGTVEAGKESAIETIGKIALNKPEIIDQSVLKKIVQHLNYSNARVTAITLRAIAMNKSELIRKNVIKALFSYLSGDSEIAETIRIIAIKKPELIEPYLQDLTSALMGDNNLDSKISIARILFEVYGTMPFNADKLVSYRADLAKDFACFIKNPNKEATILGEETVLTIEKSTNKRDITHTQNASEVAEEPKKIKLDPSIEIYQSSYNQLGMRIVNVLGDGHQLLKAQEASRQEAEKKGTVGLRAITGFDLKDVDDLGNCFYLAVAHQMQLIGHHHIRNVPEGTDVDSSLRLAVQRENFRDREWAEDSTFDRFVSEFRDVILAIIDTRHPERGFTCYYIDTDGTVTTNPGGMALELPDRPIIRLAATGNHFLSVRSHPSLEAGAITSSYNEIRQKSIGHREEKTDEPEEQEAIAIEEERQSYQIIPTGKPTSSPTSYPTQFPIWDNKVIVVEDPIMNVLRMEVYLEALFNNKVKAVESKSEIAQNKDELTLKAVAKIESIIGKEALSEIIGFYQYVSASLSSKPFSASSNKVIQVMGRLVSSLEELLDLGDLYEDVNIDNQVTIILTQLEHWFDFVASGITHVGLPPRYPDFDPDDDYSGGSGGSSSGSGNWRSDNDDQGDYHVVLLIGQNTTNATITHES